MEPMLAKIAAALTFAGTAAMVALGLGYFAHESLGVSRAIIREDALISAMLMSGFVIVALFANASGNRK